MKCSKRQCKNYHWWYEKQGQPLYCAFIDLSKAFNSVWHLGLYYKLIQLNIDSRFIRLLKNMYAQVKQKHKVSQKNGISIGTRQGCNISPTLFKMFLCDLPGIFRDPKCDPITLLDDRLSCLLYADDIVILSKSANGLQLSMDKLAEYCHKWRLNVNYKNIKFS